MVVVMVMMVMMVVLLVLVDGDDGGDGCDSNGGGAKGSVEWDKNSSKLHAGGEVGASWRLNVLRLTSSSIMSRL